ncbi:aminotransferase class I and II domain-containing protein [Hirsutella rhossiliensis]|uniref:Aminotransferase class I and II domain-containing protein n=1 Tax=Hirsutella rhossiliensis TaxID=111463 RepID=A0A9P8N921_9HYPO|nr:aminotransferase class I and II domain-containing protein [Hirsutella rhossiliensis]KAH0968231.1 aminotransferase class I and II domain-containing protein [Hirsutella rhossiliensis]
MSPGAPLKALSRRLNKRRATWCLVPPITRTLPSFIPRPYSTYSAQPPPELSSAKGALLGALSRNLDKRRETGRILEIPDPVAQANAVDFGSNDVLSISTGLLREELFRELEDHPDFAVGSRGSRVLDGNSRYVTGLEAHLAQSHNAKDALLFNSGYEANIAIWTTIPQPGDVIVYDELVHASIHDGIKGTRTTQVFSFQHNNPASFEEVLRSIKTCHPEIAQGSRTLFVAMESVYSVDGDICPVHQFVNSAKEILPFADRVFMIDESHSCGMIGPMGLGLVCHYGLENEFALRLHTFGKAIGCTGAALFCDPVIKHTLFNYARNFIFTTGPTFMVLAAVKAAHRIIGGAEGDLRRERVQKNISHFYDCLQSHPQWETFYQTGRLRIVEEDWRLHRFRTAVTPLITQPGESRALQAQLLKDGFLVHALQYPIVPLDSERLRIMLHADNTPQQVESFVEAIMRWARQRYYPPRSCKLCDAA